jgi:hypothetical protein
VSEAAQHYSAIAAAGFSASYSGFTCSQAEQDFDDRIAHDAPVTTWLEAVVHTASTAADALGSSSALVTAIAADVVAWALAE